MIGELVGNIKMLKCCDTEQDLLKCCDTEKDIEMLSSIQFIRKAAHNYCYHEQLLIFARRNPHNYCD